MTALGGIIIIGSAALIGACLWFVVSLADAAAREIDAMWGEHGAWSAERRTSAIVDDAAVHAPLSAADDGMLHSGNPQIFAGERGE